MSTAYPFDPILENMLTIDGVTGAMVADTAGNVLSAKMPAIYDSELLGQIANKTVNVALAFREIGVDSEEMHYKYESMRVMVKDLAKGFLLIMSLPSVSIPLLNVATNVTRKKIIQALSGETPPAQAPTADALVAEKVEPELPEKDVTPIPPLAMEQLKLALANYLGPVAGLLLTRTATALGGTVEKLDRQKTKELISILSKKINKDKDRTDFIKAALQAMTPYMPDMNTLISGGTRKKVNS